MTKLVQKIDKQIESLQGKIDALSVTYLTNTWKRQREQQERDRKKGIFRSQLQVLGYLKRKAETEPLPLFEQNLTASAFYEDMRCFSASKKYSENNPYVEFKYPKPDDIRVKRLQRAGITNTQELINAVEQYDALVQSAVTPPDPDTLRLRDLLFKAQMYQKGDIQFTPKQLAEELVSLACINEYSHVLDKTTPRLIQFHTLKNAVNPPFLGGFSVFGTVAAEAEQRFLGYDRGPNGGFVVNQEQAKTVKLIYKLFLDGLTCHAIAKELTERKLPTPGGKAVWSQSTVRSILTNEKYKGDALLQKEFTVDFLQKKTKKNEGEVPQYYVEGNHEAIIDPATFDYVQVEMARRTKDKHRYSGVSMFSSKIKCGECGCWYGSKVWHSTDRYRRVIYRCNRKYSGEDKCQTPHVTEDEVKAAFVSAYNQLVTEKKEIIANAEIIRKTLCVTDALQEEKGKLEEEMAVLVEMTQNIVAENARVAQDQDEYQKRYDGLVQRYDTAKARYDEVVAAISAKEAQSERLADFIKVLKAQDGTISEFDGSLWGSMVEFITVGRDKEITVTFRDGSEILA